MRGGDCGRCFHRGRRLGAPVQLLIYLDAAIAFGRSLQCAGTSERGATMQPWTLHALVWGLTAIGLIAIASMML